MSTPIDHATTPATTSSKPASTAPGDRPASRRPAVLAGVIGWTLRAPTRPGPGSVDVGFAQE